MDKKEKFELKKRLFEIALANPANCLTRNSGVGSDYYENSSCLVEAIDEIVTSLEETLQEEN